MQDPRPGANRSGNWPTRVSEWRRAIALLTLVIAIGSGRLAASPAALCDDAARRAAQQTGVPVDVLLAITRTETGRRRDGRTEPWPWTVNMEGKGLWFDTQSEALAYAYSRFKQGARSFDIGCFQINFRWHGQAFPSISAMFDPEANALYAAQFLKELHGETGAWSSAAGAYHSRTSALAQKYRVRFDRLLASLADPPPPIAGGQPGLRKRGDPGYPLFQGGARPSLLGSLTPLTRGGSARLLRAGGRPFLPAASG